MTPETDPSVFILSFRQRDELASAATRAGWRPVAARRSEGVARRLAASGAMVAVIDARGAVKEGLGAMQSIGASPAAESRALLVLVSRDDIAVLGDFFSAGATHFLASPMREAEFAEALRFAARHAERVSGGWVPEAQVSEPLGWRFDRAHGAVQLTPALAGHLGIETEVSPLAALRRFGEDLPVVIAALRRLDTRPSTALAHDLPGLGRVVQHLQHDLRSGRVHALIELLGEVPDPGAAARDLFPRRSRSVAALARDLPNALDRAEIEALFQPQVDIASGEIVGVEALARWQHPRLGEIGAEALLAAAARAGLSVELSARLQRAALDQAAAWPADLDVLRLSINITAEDIAQEGFVGRLLADVDESGFPRDRLTLELTEGGLVEELGEASRLLGALRAAGCRTAIDDFGTGYSSLAYLNTLPIDYLKLDRRMTRDILGSPRERVVVRGVIEMARSLGLTVIAEGVETPHQRDLLAAEGCHMFQGYLCAPPVDAGALEMLLRQLTLDV